MPELTQRELAIVRAVGRALDARLEELRTDIQGDIARRDLEHREQTVAFREKHLSLLETPRVQPLMEDDIIRIIGSTVQTIAGEQGPPGERGLQGLQGERGIDGAPGRDGEQGPPGERGIDGSPGRDGDRGPPGEPGERGMDGEPGPQGIPGERGEQGPPGDRGERGMPGEQGPPGERGERGLDGLPGRDGVDGQPGERGMPGEQGPPGKDGGITSISRWTEDYVHRGVGHVVLHNGSSWSAVADPEGTEPGTDDRWRCVSAGISDITLEQDETDPRNIELSMRLASGDSTTFALRMPGFMFRGLYADAETYSLGDVVASNGGSWVALSAGKLHSPGDGPAWGLLTKQGKPGRAGQPGERGPPGLKGDVGPPGVGITNLMVEGHHVIVELSTGDVKTLPVPGLESLVNRVSAVEAHLSGESGHVS